MRVQRLHRIEKTKVALVSRIFAHLLAAVRSSLRPPQSIKIMQLFQWWHPKVGMRSELLVEPAGSGLLCTDTAEIRTGFAVGLTGTLHQFVIADLDITANRNLSQVP